MKLFLSTFLLAFSALAFESGLQPNFGPGAPFVLLDAEPRRSQSQSSETTPYVPEIVRPQTEKKTEKEIEKEIEEGLIELSPDKIREIYLDYSGKNRNLFKIKIGTRLGYLDKGINITGYREEYVKRVAFACATGRSLGVDVILHDKFYTVKNTPVKVNDFFLKPSQIGNINSQGFELLLGEEKVFIKINSIIFLLKFQNAYEAAVRDPSKFIKLEWDTFKFSTADNPIIPPKVEAPNVEVQTNLAVSDGARSQKQIEKDFNAPNIGPLATETKSK